MSIEWKDGVCEMDGQMQPVKTLIVMGSKYWRTAEANLWKGKDNYWMVSSEMLKWKPTRLTEDKEETTSLEEAKRMVEKRVLFHFENILYEYQEKRNLLLSDLGGMDKFLKDSVACYMEKFAKEEGLDISFVTHEDYKKAFDTALSRYGGGINTESLARQAAREMVWEVEDRVKASSPSKEEQDNMER